MAANQLQKQKNIRQWANSSSFMFCLPAVQPRKLQLPDNIRHIAFRGGQDEDASEAVHRLLFSQCKSH